MPSAAARRWSKRAPAKVNLTLRVLGRRADGYHELESLVAFADLADRLTLAAGRRADARRRAGPIAAGCRAGRRQSGAQGRARARRARPRAHGSARFMLDKHLPVAAGLGGGSSDAAAALRLLARANGFAPDDTRLTQAARATGADVPVCLDPRAAHDARGRRAACRPPLELPPLRRVLVNPGVAVPTRGCICRGFAGRDGRSRPCRPRRCVGRALAAWIVWRRRPAETISPPGPLAACYRRRVERRSVELRGLDGCRLARMSGSGATCFALFASSGEAAAAAQRLGSERKDWWVCHTTLGAVEKRP